jgi:hypothetical protein
MTVTNQISRRLQISGVFVMAGLLVEAVCLLWSRPIAFVVFAAAGGFLISVGVVCFLYSLVSLESTSPKR